ncbi:nodulation protein NfeD [Proteobacteria bacterium 005FR1]|nr:nodulation protein NfeD [Proteobacteria bacterium 005FR1]
MEQRPLTSRLKTVRMLLASLCLLAGAIGSMQGLGQNGAGQTPLLLVDIDGVINPGSAGKLSHAISVAEAEAAPALVMRINTPGGLLATTREMVSAIAESPVPVIGYVGPAGASATSAGAFILMSTHLATMNSGTNVGAASPVAGGGGDIEGTLGKKVMSDSRAFMRSIAGSRGRNVELADALVAEAVSVTAAEAAQAGLVELVVPSLSSLPELAHGSEIQFRGQTITLDLQGRELVSVEPRLVDRLLQIIAHPQIAHLLISLGFLAIFVEILSPGLAFPGVFGSIAVVLGLVGVQTLPVNLGFLILLVMGLVLMFAEFFVAGIGVLGIGGAVAFVLGSINLFDTPIADRDRNAILWVSIGVSAAFVVTSLLITRSILSPARKKRSMEGKVGEAMVSFDEDGYVLVDGERWAAMTTEALEHGEKVVVIGTRDDRLLVTKADRIYGPL